MFGSKEVQSIALAPRVEDSYYPMGKHGGSSPEAMNYQPSWWQIAQEPCLVIRPPPPCMQANEPRRRYAWSSNGYALQNPHYVFLPTQQHHMGPSISIQSSLSPRPRHRWDYAQTQYLAHPGPVLCCLSKRHPCPHDEHEQFLPSLTHRRICSLTNHDKINKTILDTLPNHKANKNTLSYISKP